MPKNSLPLEQEEQIKFSSWLTKEGIRHTASANGEKRNLMIALKLKRMGVSPGFPDICIPIPSGCYHGLYIELKRQKGGKLSTEQINWLEFLRERGYYADVAFGFEEAKKIVLYYLGLTRPAA